MENRRLKRYGPVPGNKNPWMIFVKEKYSSQRRQVICHVESRLIANPVQTTFLLNLQDPRLRHTDRMKRLAEEWKGLSPVERSHYIQLSREYNFSQWQNRAVAIIQRQQPAEVVHDIP